MKDIRIKCKTIEEAKKVLQLIEDRHPEVRWGGGEKPTEFYPWEQNMSITECWIRVSENSIFYTTPDTSISDLWVNATSAKRFLRKSNTSIHIYQRGKAVIAHESETGREGIAKCSPNDKFDFSVGARIALLRLFGEEVPDSLTGKEKEEFKVGDRVIIRDWDDMEKEFGLNSLGSIKCKCGFTADMKKLCGKVAQIKSFDKFDNRVVRLEFENFTKDTYFSFSTDMIKKVSKNYKPTKLHVGDKVEIVNAGKCYTTYPKWVVQNIEDKETIAKYAYGFMPRAGVRGKVLKIAVHGRYSDRPLLYIRSDISDKCYLVEIKGVKKVES